MLCSKDHNENLFDFRELFFYGFQKFLSAQNFCHKHYIARVLAFDEQILHAFPAASTEFLATLRYD